MRNLVGRARVTEEREMCDLGGLGPRREKLTMKISEAEKEKREWGYDFLFAVRCITGLGWDWLEGEMGQKEGRHPLMVSLVEDQ